MHRRTFLSSIGLAAPAAMAMNLSPGEPQQQTPAGAPAVPVTSGRLKQGVTTQGLLGGNSRSFEDRCKLAVALGIKSFDFATDPTWWPVMKQYGLVSSLYRLPRPTVPGAPPPARGQLPAVPPGWEEIGHKEAQGDYLKACHAAFDTCAANGFPTMIILGGQRSATVNPEQGADNAVEWCNQIKAHAEDKGINLVMEFINSKGIQGGIGTFFDNMAWGVNVMKRVNSPRVKILYDCFHAQLMEGNIVSTIRDNIQYIGHFHVGGVPGRHTIDGTQELNYHFVAQAIADLNYQGYICHEWGPAPGTDPVAELTKAIQILTV